MNSGNTLEALLQNMLREGLTYQQLKDLDIAGLVHKLKSGPLIRAHKRFVRKMMQIIKCPDLERLNPRVMNAAFMIVLHPMSSFEAAIVPGSVEEAVFRSGTAMLHAFDAICKAPSSARIELIKHFQTPLLAYMQDFAVWKIPDNNKIISRLERALFALYQARQQIQDGDVELNAAFDTQIERLRSKMVCMDSARLDQFDAMRRSMALPA